MSIAFTNTWNSFSQLRKMLNTFENYRRHTLRRNEREWHLRRIESLSNSCWDNESAICSIVDDISGGPLLKSTPGKKRDQKVPLGLLGLSLIVAVFVLGLRNANQLFSSCLNRACQIDNFSSLLAEWNLTSQESLEDSSSAPARARQWIISGGMDYSESKILKERYALAVIYFETQDPSLNQTWTNNENWLSSDSVCYWYGVDCHSPEIGYGVRSLDLSSNRLVGSLPRELGLLNATSLALFSNSLTGTIPASLGRMTGLTLIAATLYLDSNFFSGTIPTTFGKLKDIVDIRLSENLLTGRIPLAIGALRILQIAYFDNNNLSGPLPPEAFERLFLLHELHLHQNNLSGSLPVELGRQKLMRVLYMDGNRFTGTIPRTIGNMDRLESLYLSKNYLSGSFPNTSERLSNLKYFQAHENRLSGSIPPDLGLWTDLETLKLQNNSLTGHFPTKLGDLSNLKTLQMEGNKIVGSVPSIICDLELRDFTSDCDGRLDCGCCTVCYHD
eukprot:scaffold3020_cov118-Cylindrotheca_fusiformis.AAC.3